MRRRFRFEHDDAEYGVFGELGPESVFSVVQLLVGADRTAAPPGAPAMKVLAVVRGADSVEQLRREIEKTFPDLTGFRPF